MSQPSLTTAMKDLLLAIAGRSRALRWAKGWKPEKPGTPVFRHNTGEALVGKGLAETRYGPGPVKLHLTPKGEELALQIKEARQQRARA